MHTDATTTKKKKDKKPKPNKKKNPTTPPNQNQMESGDPDERCSARSVGSLLKGRKLETAGIPSPLCNSKA